MSKHRLTGVHNAWVAASLGLVANLGGCKCGAEPAVVTDAPSASSASMVPSTGDAGGLPLSLPFASSRGPGGDIYVAGLVAARNVIGIARFDKLGKMVWSVDAFTDVAWTPDAEVRVLGAEAGVAVSWRGLRAKALVRQLVAIDQTGKIMGDPQAIGVGACATEDGIVWPESNDGGSSEIVRRPFSWSAPTSIGTVTRDLDPLLACGSHRVFVLEEGSEEIGLSVFPANKDAKGPVSLIAASPNDNDDEREHDEFTVGDELGVVRATARGKLLLREGTPSLGAWRAFPKPLSDDDDIVAVDGDATWAYAVITRDAADRCDGNASATDVRLLRTKRAAAKSDLKDDDTLLAAETCGVDVGAFWTASLGSKFVIAWVELAPRTGASLPMAGFAYRVVGDPDVKHVVQPADGMSFAGCDDTKCYAVALTRTDADAMAPGTARVLSFP